MCLLKFRHLTWLIVALLYGHALFAQKNDDYKLYLRNGTFSPPANLSGAAAGATLRENALPAIGKLVIIQFNDIPGENAVAQLKNAGIELLEYVPDNAYTTVIRQAPNAALLVSANARAIIELTADQKIHAALTAPTLPAHTLKVPGKVDVSISYPRSIALSDARQDLQKHNFEIISETLSRYQVLEVRLDTNRLEQLAALPWVEYIEATMPPLELLNDKSVADSRANVLNSPLPGGRKLDGEGVTIGIGDTGNLDDHADLTGRVISATPTVTDWHGLHIAGTAAGAGIVNEKYRGYAPKAKIVKRLPGGIWFEAAAHVRDFGMVVTNSAYGIGNYCSWFGDYFESSSILDRQAGELPNLLHVFAGGNSGLQASCISGLPVGYGTVQGLDATAKNVITVGRTGANGIISPASSRGPTSDGRIKPELVAPGGSIFSLIPNDAYQSGSGTSMASPAVTGGTALLYQRYRQLNGQNNPKGGLVKALLLNGASDWGLPGPDYVHGFGMMNLLRSVIMMEKGNYFTGTLANQGSAEFQVNVPAGTSVLKVMLYWHDPASAVVAGGRKLVNNLDLHLVRPGGGVQLPLVPNPAAPASPAVASLDSINNAEQVVIANPEAGSYTVKVAGHNIPTGSQEYFVVYDIIERSTVLTYPVGGERFTKGDAVNLSWDSYENPASTYALSYSLNNGTSWSSINAAIPAGTTRFSWTVPDAFTTTAKIRLVQNETGAIRESGAFSIMALPVVTMQLVQCPGYAALQWTKVNGATDYEVMRLQGAEMKPVGVTTELKYTFNSLSRDSTYYFSVRPRLNGIPGRRAVAIKYKPDSGTCAGSISDNDIGIDSLVSPKAAGRMLTSTAFSPTQAITIGIRNFDDQPITKPVQVGYSIGGAGAAVHWETLTSGIPALGYLAYTFTKTADVQAIGAYVVSVFVKMDDDLALGNNQLVVEARHLPNPAITLPHTQDFESLPVSTVRSDRSGLDNAPGYDFSSQKSIARLRTYIGPDGSYSGDKALILDTDARNNGLYSTTVIGTYNLADYAAQGKEVRLDFRFAGSIYYSPNADEGVYIRGKDTDPWIFAFDYHYMWNLPVDKNFYLGTVMVTELLKRNSQELSTSFQVKWHQYVATGSESWHLIDDVRLYTTRTDVAVTRVERPELPVCSSNYEVSVEVTNKGAHDLYNVPLQVTVDGVELYNFPIFLLKAGESSLVMCGVQSSMSSEGDHVVEARATQMSDVNPADNALRTVLISAPVIAEFPYLEDFEHGPGGWQTIDAKPVWQLGTPNAVKIKNAASGVTAWATDFGGVDPRDSVAYLYSPCFFARSIEWARLSFSYAIDPDVCENGFCDLLEIEMSNGNGWQKVYAISSAYPEDGSRWRVGTAYLSNSGEYFRLRFVIKTRKGFGTEGIAIDDIHIHSGYSPVYFNPYGQETSVMDEASGNKWIDMVSFGITASINPNGQNLGKIMVNTYVNYGEAHHVNGQYYLGRNFKFTMSQPSFPEPVGVRLYFADSDIERLVSAPDTTGVFKPGSAFELGITKYSGSNEDGDLTNNTGKGWAYYRPSDVKIVPYYDGYYAEFQTKSFSEFWLAKGFLGLGDPMPVTLATFTAKPRTDAENKQTVLVEWQTAREEAFSHFEVEVAKDREGLLENRFTKVGEVPGQGGNSRYAFTDNAPLAERTSYYRLKLVDTDGSFAYSSVRAVNFEGEKLWKVFPNPAEKRIFVEFEEKAGKVLHFSVSDVGGRVVFTDKAVADGRAQQKEIGLSTQATVPGIYLLKVVSEDRERVFKIIRK